MTSPRKRQARRLSSADGLLTNDEPGVVQRVCPDSIPRSGRDESSELLSFSSVRPRRRVFDGGLDGQGVMGSIVVVLEPCASQRALTDSI